MEQVKIPREVGKAIENLRNAGMTDFYIIGSAYVGNCSTGDIGTITKYIRQNTADFDDEDEKGYTHIMKALVNGYEVEQTPEEKVKKYFDEQTKACHEQYDRQDNTPYAIRKVLDTLNIKIDGVNT